MKSITILVAALYAFLIQTIGLQYDSGKPFGTVEEMDGVTCFSLSKNTINTIDVDLKDQNKNLSENLNQIRIIIYHPEEGKVQGGEFIHKAISLLPSPYKQLVDRHELDKQVEIWMKGKKNKFYECHLFIKNENDDENQFIVSFYGKFDINQIKKLQNTGKNISAGLG